MELAALILVVALSADAILGAQWSYEGEKGPLYWHELFPQACSGRYQSPIDIRSEQTIYNPDLRDFALWNDPPGDDVTMTLLNNGHTIQVVTNGKLHVANGGLPYVYKTAQFHFHWGHAKHHGSEHLIDGKAYPLELHIVNWNSELYGDIGQAVTEKQGLAVLGVMFQVGDEESEDLKPLIEAMDKVADPDEGNQVELEPLSIRDLLPDDISQYYRYNGSLTTPGCFESVVWTVFANPKKISHRQMHKFREMLQARPQHGGHHKRSLKGRRERRALEVLDELALTPEQQERFRRDLEHKKNQADKHSARMDEEGAAKTHATMMDQVHETVEHEEANGHHVTEVEIEYMQEKLVNNFRPVQPLNDRLVYRSFKLRDSHHGHHHGGNHHHGHDNKNNDLPDENTLRERLKMYGSSGAQSIVVSSLFVVLASFLLSLFL